jgi:DNA-binding protein H-NS
VKSINLKNMSFDDLVELRDRADRLIRQQAAGVRRSLEVKLARLAKFTSEPKQRRKSTLKGRKASPKYRNPDDASETWAGRGGTPRWLKALLAQGRKLEEFAIKKVAGGGKTGVAKKRRSKKAR